jgi:hypothetical protein
MHAKCPARHIIHELFPNEEGYTCGVVSVHHLTEFYESRCGHTNRGHPKFNLSAVIATLKQCTLLGREWATLLSLNVVKYLRKYVNTPLSEVNIL